MSPTEREKLAVLNGDRPNNKPGAALRLKHAQALLENIPTEPTGVAADDIQAIYVGLRALRIALAS